MIDNKENVGGGVANASVPHGSGMGSDPSNGADEVITFKEVEEALVEAVWLWWRTPGAVGPGGRGGMPASGVGGGIQIGIGFGKDGPWELADRDLYGPDVDKDAPIRAAPLTRAEVMMRDARSDWLLWPRHDHDRKLLATAARQMASRGYTSPAFTEMRAAMGLDATPDALRKRYNRMIFAIATKLNCDAEARKAAGLRR